MYWAYFFRSLSSKPYFFRVVVHLVEIKSNYTKDSLLVNTDSF